MVRHKKGEDGVKDGRGERQASMTSPCFIEV